MLVRGRVLSNALDRNMTGAIESYPTTSIVQTYTPVTNRTGRTSLKFFEREPSKLTKAEKAGVPKGDRN